MAYLGLSDELQTKMRRALLTRLVQRDIFCPITGQVLDVDTVVTLVDDDGDPAMVVSQDGYRRILAERPGVLEVLAAKGYVVDETTVKAATA